MSRPDVFAYLDFRTFLADWFEARKREDPAYSYAAFAAASGCSKATLANVIRGERTPRPATLDAFANAMSLSPAAKNYLGMLVELDAARDAGRRLAVMERLLTNERYGQFRNADRHSAADIDRYLAQWWIPAIREMVALPGFREDPAWIARQMHPPIEAAQAAQAIDTLLSLGFVERNDQGQLVQSEIRFGTDAETQQAAVTRFYRERIPELLRGLDSARARTQHVMGATISLDRGSVPEAKARLHEMVNQLATVADSRPREAEARVFQVLVMMVPVSEEVGDPPAQVSDP
ncbi:MAG: TIGR02147 family protein [Alphaproteobacteria bacterium]|nr:TIGR02147 family protein [Alphaproteobacteria bacterium]